MKHGYIVCLLTACGDPVAALPDAPTDAPAGFVVAGTVVAMPGASVPTAGQLAATWLVSASSPDYLFKFGDGTSTGASAQMAFSTDPPAAAVNAEAVGVAFLTIHEPATTIPDGMVDETTLEVNLRGISSNHAVIFKVAPLADLTWLDAFPTGYACGRCVSAAPGESFDTWVPVACDELVIDVAIDLDTLEICNWT